ncbi:MAG: tetratricopeptide repeat protein, partial [Methanothrix sp.]|nr:tetratricopeptide repeat protein [Methanothrix sp.]
MEWSNIQAGVYWAEENLLSDDFAAELCNTYYYAGLDVLNLRLHPDKKISWLKSALTASKQLGDGQAEGVWLGSLGQAHAAMGQPEKAIEYFQMALEIAQQIKDKQNEGAWLGSLGQAHTAMGQPEKAIEYFQMALEIAQQIKDKRNEGAWLGSL